MSDHDAPTPPRETATTPRVQASRTVLGVLLALLVLAVLLALWFLIVGGDETAADNVDIDASTVPAIPIPTSTPTPPPVAQTGVASDAGSDTTAAALTTPEPTTVPTGFEACGTAQAPNVSARYIVDTLTTPLNQRAEPSVEGSLMGSFDPGQTGLIFNGECLVNLADGYVWWQISNGNDNVWVASDFVTPSG